MKIVRRLFRFIKGRWMRRLVWLPCVLLGCVVLGATLESKGFRLAVFNNVQHRFPAALNRPTVVSFTPVDNGGYSQQVKSSQSTPNNAVFGSPAQFGNAVNSFPSTVARDTRKPSPANQLPTQALQTPTYSSNQYTSNQYMSNPQPAYGSSPIPGSHGVAGYRQATWSFTAPSQIASSQPNALNQLAMQIQAIHDDPVKLRENLSQMLALAIEQFDTKQNDERTNLKKAKEALVRWDEAISERESLKRSLVDSHLAQLLNSPDKLNWSFSGAQLLNGQPNQPNYQDVLTQLWTSHANQNTSSAVEPQFTRSLPTYSSDSDLNSFQAPTLNVPVSNQPVFSNQPALESAPDAPRASDLPVPTSPIAPLLDGSIDAPSALPPPSLPVFDEKSTGS